MANGIELEIKGLKEINKAIHEIPAQLGKRVVTSALREGAKIIQKEARSLAPRKSGRLRRAIKVKKSRIHTKPRMGKFGFYIKINPGKKRDDMQGAYYGHIIDGGWNTRGKGASRRSDVTSSFNRRTGRKTMRGKTDVSGKEFMLRAYRRKHKIAADYTVKAVERGVETVKRRLGL